ncbi:hypothetical protein HPB47_008758 [Ixodes persulcatus]|uniref:Uncharacterized protein n=1 Tax=Ixodes persulcatus TaxID=34615 RepID=A0AC60P3U0_IXOPE|nr:hypothetical protein HPB47_008758 [Ixodes persulcatus]
MSSSGTPARGNYHAKTLREKVEILREVDAGKANKVEIAKKHAIPRSTLSTYVRNRKTIEDAYEAEVFAHGRKRLRSAKHPDLEKALITWVKEMRSQDLPLSGPIIMAKAAEFALHLKHHDFAVSEGWFHRFRQRHDLVFRIVSGEGKDVSMETCAIDTGECEVVFEGMRDLLQDVSFADYVDADSSAVICGAMTDEDIIAQVVGEPVAEAENDVDNEEEEVEVEEAPIRPSAPEVMDALNVARLFFSFEEGKEDALRLVQARERACPGTRLCICILPVSAVCKRLTTRANIAHTKNRINKRIEALPFRVMFLFLRVSSSVFFFFFLLAVIMSPVTDLREMGTVKIKGFTRLEHRGRRMAALKRLTLLSLLWNFPLVRNSFHARVVDFKFEAKSKQIVVWPNIFYSNIEYLGFCSASFRSMCSKLGVRFSPLGHRFPPKPVITTPCVAVSLEVSKDGLKRHKLCFTRKQSAEPVLTISKKRVGLKKGNKVRVNDMFK